MIITLFFFLLVLFYFLKWGKKHWQVDNQWLIPVLFLGKCGFALFFLYIYTYHYGGGELTADAARFFHESKVFFNLFFEHPEMYFKFLLGLENDALVVDQYMPELSHWNASSRTLPNDSRNVIRINSLLHFVSNGEILVHFLIFSFVSFLAALDLSMFVRRVSNVPLPIVLVFLTLMPSIAFWSSSIIKEPLMLAGLFFLIRGVFDQHISTKGKVLRWVIGLVLMWLFKPYILFLLLPVLLYYLFIARFFSTWMGLLSSATLTIILGIGLLAALGKLDDGVHIVSRQQHDFMNVRDGGLYLIKDSSYQYYIYFENRDNFLIQGSTAQLLKPTGALIVHNTDYSDRVPYTLDSVGHVYDVFLRLTQAGSGIDVTRINDSGWTMVKMIPEVLVNTVVRPWPWDKGSWLIIPAFIENVIVIFLVLLSFVFRRSLNGIEKQWVLTLMLFSLGVFCVVGWTTPVLGAIVRYKIPATAALVIVSLIQLDYQKLIQRWKQSIT